MATAGFTIPTIPGEMQWHDSPRAWEIEGGNGLAITAGAETDWFIDPAGTGRKDNAPCALLTPPGGPFLLRARVAVDFVSTFDAGVLQVRERDDLWGKLCFEYSPQGQPMVVSVVTRGFSDDCNSAVIDSREVYLRVYWHAPTFAFHYSRDGRFWHLVRYFTLGNPEHLRVGFSSQSPTGQGCRARFTEIDFRQASLKDIRSGE